MYQIHYLNKISSKGTALWTENYTLTDELEQAQGIILRSANMHEMTLPENLLAVGRAGAGVNNIPLTTCADQGIVVFNTPGANANSVMELALCGMLLASRDVVGGINWVQTIRESPDIAKLVEKGKSQFAGHEIRGKKLGVIGLGAIGGPLANAARKLGMTVYGCDPFISIDAAWHLDSQIIRVKTREEIYANCDIITLHVPLTENNYHMIDAAALRKMKRGVILINTARGKLIETESLIQALESGQVGGAGIDTLEEESGVMHVHVGTKVIDNRSLLYLKQFPNVLYTQHYAFFTQEAAESMVRCGIQSILNGVRGIPTPCEVQ